MKIPRLLYSSATHRPFDRCSRCGVSLQDNNLFYTVEKGLRLKGSLYQYEVSYELALCTSCRQKMKSLLPKKVNRLLLDLWEQHVRPGDRWLKNGSRKSLHIEDWLSQCIFTGLPLEKIQGGQITALCNGEHLLFSHYPYLVSNQILMLLYEHYLEAHSDVFNNYRMHFQSFVNYTLDETHFPLLFE